MEQVTIKRSDLVEAATARRKINKRRKFKPNMRTIQKVVMVIAPLLIVQLLIAMTDTKVGYIARSIPLILYDGIASGRVIDAISLDPKDAIMKQFERLPQEMKEDFYNDGVKIIFEVPAERANGSTFYIALYSSTPDNKYIGIMHPRACAATGSIYHEFAHYINKRTGTMLCSSEEFQKAMGDGKRAEAIFELLHGGDTSTEENRDSEMFAEMFSCYMTRPTVLKYTAPSLYEYFDSFVKQYQ